MAGKKPEHTTIGKDLLRNGSGVVTSKGTKDTPGSASSQVNGTAEGATTRKRAATKKAPAKKRATSKTTKPPAPDEPWDQQPDETAPAFAAFAAYRDMGVTRSTAKVARQLGKSKTLIDRWSGVHGWVIRVSSYDRFLDREWQQEVKERKRRAARRNADMAAQAMDLVASRIEQMTKHFDFSDDDYDKERPPPLDVLDLRRLVDSLGKLERLALGEATENVQVTGKDGGPVQIDYSKLTDEERIERMKQLRGEIDKRLDAVGAGGDDQ
jgi:hypothetical protein